MPSLHASDPPMSGRFRDVVRDAAGHVTHETDWQRNVIVDDCRRLLATFMQRASGTLGIKGLLVGAGQPAWDLVPPPAPTPAVSKLEDPNPFLVPASQLEIKYLDTANAVTAVPTNRIQVVATLPAGMPTWPDPPKHTTATLREFGLVGSLAGTDVLINYRMHTAIAKDPLSTLVRTIWLTF